jgi:outer membrane biosynthesis protein TonB
MVSMNAISPGRSVRGILAAWKTASSSFPESDAHGVLIHVKPEYPATAKTHGIEGTVVLDAVVDRDGAIKEGSIRADHALLAESALETVRQ